MVGCSDPILLSDFPGRVKCPPSIAKARKKICDALIAKGVGGLINDKVVTGPKHAACLLETCSIKNNVYCFYGLGISCDRGDTCGFSCGIDSQQNPHNGIGLCIPIVIKGCHITQCSNGIIETILHEMNSNCGSHHNQGRNPDHCDDWADSQCRSLKL